MTVHGGNSKALWQVLTGVVSVLAFITGLVIGGYRNEAAMSDKYVKVEQYRVDIARLEGKIDRLLLENRYK